MSCRVFFCPLGGLATHSWSVVGAGFRHSSLVGGLEMFGTCFIFPYLGNKVNN